MNKTGSIALIAAALLGTSAAAQAWLTARAQVPPPGKLVSVGDQVKVDQVLARIKDGS